jgi:hypothetical protein
MLFDEPQHIWEPKILNLSFTQAASARIPNYRRLLAYLNQSWDDWPIHALVDHRCKTQWRLVDGLCLPCGRVAGSWRQDVKNSSSNAVIGYMCMFDRIIVKELICIKVRLRTLIKCDLNYRKSLFRIPANRRRRSGVSAR